MSFGLAGWSTNGKYEYVTAAVFYLKDGVTIDEANIGLAQIINNLFSPSKATHISGTEGFIKNVYACDENQKYTSHYRGISSDSDGKPVDVFVTAGERNERWGTDFSLDLRIQSKSDMIKLSERVHYEANSFFDKYCVEIFQT